MYIHTQGCLLQFEVEKLETTGMSDRNPYDIIK